MKTFESYISGCGRLSEAVFPQFRVGLPAASARNPLYKELDKQCTKYGYKLNGAFNEVSGGRILFTTLDIVPTRSTLPKLTSTLSKAKRSMRINVSAGGALTAAELTAWMKEMQNALKLCEWIDKQDLSMLPSIEIESEVIEADEKKPTNFEVAYRMFDKKGQIVSKRKAFKTDKARAKFVEKIKQDGNFYEISGYLDD